VPGYEAGRVVSDFDDEDNVLADAAAQQQRSPNNGNTARADVQPQLGQDVSSINPAPRLDEASLANSENNETSIAQAVRGKRRATPSKLKSKRFRVSPEAADQL
jgi:hypothetical protein